MPAVVVERSGLTAARLLAGIVGLSFAVRVALAWLRSTPVYFGDEYLYSSLGRSLAETGRPLVRGQALRTSRRSSSRCSPRRPGS